jgi:hypothetical protein
MLDYRSESHRRLASFVKDAKEAYESASAGRGACSTSDARAQKPPQPQALLVAVNLMMRDDVACLEGQWTAPPALVQFPSTTIAVTVVDSVAVSMTIVESEIGVTGIHYWYLLFPCGYTFIVSSLILYLVCVSDCHLFDLLRYCYKNYEN